MISYLHKENITMTTVYNAVNPITKYPGWLVYEYKYPIYVDKKIKKCVTQ